MYVNFKLFCHFEQVVTYQKRFLEQALHKCSTKQFFLKSMKILLKISTMEYNFSSFKSCTFMKNGFRHQCFLVKFQKFSEKLFSIKPPAGSLCLLKSSFQVKIPFLQPLKTSEMGSEREHWPGVGQTLHSQHQYYKNIYAYLFNSTFHF